MPFYQLPIPREGKQLMQPLRPPPQKATVFCVRMSMSVFLCYSINLAGCLFDRRNSWQMWENYAEVAADVGNFAQVG